MTDIEAILQQMTLEEKAALCTGATAWNTTPIERLGVPQMTVADGPHGIRRTPDVNSLGLMGLPATCFPTASSLSSTWNPELIWEMGQALAEEAIALKVDVVLGPGNNMKRSPLCGRNFEYLSEDPYLAGEMATALINGIQSRGVGTSMKHFAVNNQEYERFRVDALVDERTLREIYLPAFEAAVKNAKPWTIMCAYNKVNGSYCSENHKLLVDILKNEWGFEGFVVSDWGAVHDRVASLRGGLDLEMPGPRQRRTQAVVDAVRSGALAEAVLNDSVRRILRIVFRAAQTPKGAGYDQAAHHSLARRVSAEGMVLLKNNGILPLKNTGSIAVIGHSAKEAHFQGGGSSRINATQVDVPFNELRSLLPNTELTYSEGYPDDAEFQQGLIDEAVGIARSADVALLFISLPGFKESEGYDRPDIDLTDQQVALIQAVSAVQPKTVVVLNNGACVAMSAWINGVAAVLEAWMMGQAGGGAIADVLTGKVTPSGKLSETFPIKTEDAPSHINFPGGGGEVRYGEGIFIGYRYYEAKNMPVLFPFGHGLSYTTFEYSNPRLSAATFKDVDGLSVSVDVTNTGKVTGKETVQVYIHDQKSTLPRPEKELKAFAKVELQPGETKTVTLWLGFRAFAYYHPAYKQWITEDGEIDILVGASSADIRYTLTAMLQSSLQLPSVLTRESTLRDWLADPRGKVVSEAVVQLMIDKMPETFGAGAGDKTKKGMDMYAFLLEMPILSVLDFQEKFLPMPAEQLVDKLLREVHGG
jgi:beta-glucosidase